MPPTTIARLTLLALACLPLAAGCGGRSGAPPPQGPPIPASDLTGARTVVSLTFDDGIPSQSAALPMLRSAGLRVTFYVNSGRLGDPDRMTWAQLAALKAAGHEVAGHTRFHGDVGRMGPGQARREICDDRAALADHGFPVTDFAYPLGSSSPRAEAVVKACGYRSARTVGGVLAGARCRRVGATTARCPFAEKVPPPLRYEVRTPGSVRADDSLADLQGYVTQAERHGGGWVVLVFHGVCDRCGLYAVSPGVMQRFVGWLASRRSRGTAVATVDQALAAR